MGVVQSGGLTALASCPPQTSPNSQTDLRPTFPGIYADNVNFVFRLFSIIWQVFSAALNLNSCCNPTVSNKIQFQTLNTRVDYFSLIFGHRSKWTKMVYLYIHCSTGILFSE